MTPLPPSERTVGNSAPSIRNWAQRHCTFLALVLYLLCASLLLIPIHFDISTRLIATKKPPDAITALWFFRWWPYAITHQINPFICHILWWPYAKNLTWANGAPLMVIPMWPITAAFGPLVAYNVLAILAPALNAFFAYLLCRELEADFFGALIGGFIFGFSSYAMTQLLAHLFLEATWALPFLVWIALRWFKRRMSSRQFLMGAAAAFIVQFGISLEILATTILFGGSALLLAWILAGPGESRTKLAKLIKLTALALMVCAAVVSPWLWVMLHASSHIEHSIFKPGEFSADLANFVIPTKLTALLGAYFSPYSAKFNGNITEQGSYLGLPLIIICGLFAWEFRKTRTAKLLVATALLTFIMSLGPDLLWRRHVLIAVMPEALFLHIPLLLDALPARFTLYLWLVVAMMAALWFSRSKVPLAARVGLISLAVIFIAPNLAAGYWSSKPENPKFFATNMYKHYISRGENVLLFPFFNSGGAMLWQEETNFYFPITGGYIAALPHNLLTHFPAFSALLRHRVSLGLVRNTERFFYHFHVHAVVVPDAPIYKPIRAYFALIGCHAIHAGGIDLYNLPRRTSHFVSYDTLALAPYFYNHPSAAPARAAYKASGGKDPVACAVLGFVHYNQHQYAAAIPYLRQSLSVYPYQPKAIACLAHCYLRLGNHKMAINDLARGLYLMPNSPRLYLAMGDMRMVRHQYAIAVAIDNIALRFVPHDAHARCALAAALDALGQWSEAKAQFLRALKEDPTSRAVHYIFGRALLQHGNPNAALTELGAVAKSDPDYHAVRQLLAEALSQTGHPHQAAALLRPYSADKTPATRQPPQ